MMITKKRAQEILEVLDILRDEFFKERKKEYPYSEWERKREKVKERLRNLPEYVRRAVENLCIEKGKRGRPEKLELEKKVFLFLFTRLLSKSNRGTEEVLELFQPLFGFDVSYKYIERLYSDEEVKLALHNLFLLLLEDEGTSGKFSGDGSGYSLSVETHYKTEPKKKGKKYLYVFKMIDLDTGMYVAFGFSKKSEKDAFNKAILMLKKNNIRMESVSLDKYYSTKKTLEMFDRKISVFVIPKKNISKLGIRWSDIFRRIIEDPIAYLSRYFLRNLNESGFSSDKRRFGDLIRQKRDDRQETALFSIAILHNFYAIRVESD